MSDPEPRAPRPREGGKGLVLIAEDEPDIRELAALVLERAGYATISVGDGQSALEAARIRRPALCFLDVMMPRLNGFEVLRGLRADPQTAPIKVILCTATIQDERELREGGPDADGYLRKPFTPSELSEQVAALV